MNRSSTGAILALAVVAGAVGFRLWTDSRELRGEPVEAQDSNVPPVESVAEFALRPDIDPAADDIERVSVISDIGHLGEPLDPDGEFVQVDAEALHIGAFVDPDIGFRQVAGQDAVHIGIARDPDDDWRPPPVGETRHIGDPMDPDAPPVADGTVSHLGVRLDPAVEE